MRTAVNLEDVLPDDLVVVDDSRGMASLLRLLGDGSPAIGAADALLASRERLLVCTGFPVDGHAETDGPAGAIVLARALRSVGSTDKPPVLVSWPEAIASWAPLLGDLPRDQIRRGQPSARIAGAAVTVEVCGRLADGSYRNMRGIDIRADAPWFEDAIGEHALIAIGDGGNEFGMGSAPKKWFEARTVRPPVSTCDVLVVGQVSNWATLAVVAALARKTGMDLLPTPAAYQDLLEGLVRCGALDGVRRVAEPTEDGFELGRGMAVVDELRRWVRA